MRSARRILSGILISLSIAVMRAPAQDSSNVNATRLIVGSAATAVTVVGVHLYQRRAWWQGPRAPFRFENDWNYAWNIDKFGHVYGAYTLSSLFDYSMMWIGFAQHTSAFWGSVLGMSYELYVEVEDGFHKEYGFSPGDAFSDLVGGMVPLVQTAFPLTKNFQLKWSYVPSRGYLNALKEGQGKVFIDDYQGQTYWLSIDPHFMMSEYTTRSIPSWLGIAFGTAVRNIDQPGQGERLWSICLDYKFSKIKTESDFLHALFGALDFFHLPAPGVRIEGHRFKLGMLY